jgi:hypothetical protein
MSPETDQNIQKLKAMLQAMSGSESSLATARQFTIRFQAGDAPAMETDMWLPCGSAKEARELKRLLVARLVKYYLEKHWKPDQ